MGMPSYELDATTHASYISPRNSREVVGKAGKRLHYKGTQFFRLIPGYLVQGGDVVLNNGRGGDSIYGKFRLFVKFDVDEHQRIC